MQPRFTPKDYQYALQAWNATHEPHTPLNPTPELPEVFKNAFKRWDAVVTQTKANFPLDMMKESSDFLACRYPRDIYTKRQDGFSITDACPSSFLIPRTHELPKDIYPGVKINNQFALGEGPFSTNWPTLLDRLKAQKIQVVVGVGEPTQNGIDKFYPYMNESRSVDIDARTYFLKTTQLNPEDMPEFGKTNICFYRYEHTDGTDFYLMHIPLWPDHDLSRFDVNDKKILAFDALHGAPRFVHCSAGVGRSVTVMLMQWLCKFISDAKDSLSEEKFLDEFEKALREIKSLKPGAGNESAHLCLEALGLADDLYQTYLEVKDRLAKGLPEPDREISRTAGTFLSDDSDGSANSDDEVVEASDDDNATPATQFGQMEIVLDEGSDNEGEVTTTMEAFLAKRGNYSASFQFAGKLDQSTDSLEDDTPGADPLAWRR